MRAALALLFVAFLLITAALNAAAVCDALLALYASAIARTARASAWMLIGICLGAVALALMSRRAYRQIDEDFPESGIGAADLEDLKRNQRS